jgi:hypothetical protein
MRRVLHPLLALLLSMLLVGSQQAALAHMLGHVLAPAAVQSGADVAADGDGDHGAALALSHACTTCIAFAGADLAPPAPPRSAGKTGGATSALAGTVAPAPTLAFLAAFRSRAPPLF